MIYNFGVDVCVCLPILHDRGPFEYMSHKLMVEPGWSLPVMCKYDPVLILTFRFEDWFVPPSLRTLELLCQYWQFSSG